MREKLRTLLVDILAQAGLGKAISEMEALRQERDRGMDIVHAMFYRRGFLRSGEDEEQIDKFKDQIDDIIDYEDEHYEGEPNATLSLPYDLLKSIAVNGYSVGPKGGRIEIPIAENVKLKLRIHSPAQSMDVQYSIIADTSAFSIVSAPMYAPNVLTGQIFETLLAVARKNGKAISAEINDMVQEVLVARQERRLFETALPHFVKAFGQENNIQYRIDFDSEEFDSDAVMRVRLTNNKCAAFPLSMSDFNEEFEKIVPVVKELCDIHRTISSEFSLESEHVVADRMDRLESHNRQSKASVTFTAATSFVTSERACKATSPMAILRAIMVELDTMGMDYSYNDNNLEVYSGNFKLSFEPLETERSAVLAIEYLNPFREMKRVNYLPLSQCIEAPFSRFFRDLVSELPDLDIKLHELLAAEDKKQKGYNDFMRRVRSLVGEHVFGYEFTHLLCFDTAPSCLAYLSMELEEGIYVTVRLTPTTCERRIKSLVDVCTRMEKLRTNSGIEFQYKTCNIYMKWQKAV